MVKISIILTTYNSGKTLERTIDSVLNQSGINEFFEIEFIVVDDCSTDNTCETLKNNGINFLSTGSRSGGPNKGRNMGLKQASGKFICFIDHDDVWDSEKLLEQLKIIEQYPVVTTGYTVVDTLMKKSIERKKSGNFPLIYQNNETFLNKLKRENSGQNFLLSTIMIQSELKNFLFEENFGLLDFDWILRLTENQTTAEIPKCLVTRYVDSFNLSLNNEYRKIDFYLALYTIESYFNKYSKEAAIGTKHTYGSRARYHYLQDDMKSARKFFFKSEINWKLGAYLVTTFFWSSYVRKKFIVFG